MNTVFFFIGAVLLYGAWGALVVMGKADAHEYIIALGAGLSWLATHVTKQSAAPASAVPLEGLAATQRG
jgi:hypothetical protein